MKPAVTFTILLVLSFFSSLPAGGADFIRGDANDDGSIDITDGVFILDWLFAGGSEPGCLSAADANDNSSVDLSDAIYTLGFLFLGGRAPGEPFPGCGRDPTEDGLGCAVSTQCGGGDAGEFCEASAAGICFPAARGSFPGVLYNHGGRGDSVGGDPAGTCEALAAAGYVGHSKLRRPLTPIPPGQEDVAEGLEELLEVRCLDRERLAVMGFSRGALLSLDLAIANPRLFDAVVLMAPAPANGMIWTLLEDPRLTNVTAEFLVMVSENDQCQGADHYAIAERVEEELRAAGLQVTFVPLPPLPQERCGHYLFDTVSDYCEVSEDFCYWRQAMSFLAERLR